MAGDEAKMTRMVRREISRRLIDSSRLDVRYTHGSVYLAGYIRKLRGHENVDLEEELTVLARILRTKDGIRDVHYDDVTFNR